MCLGDSTPNLPAPVAPPPPPQEVKTPDTIQATRRKQSGSTAGIAGGTLLTGPSGVANNTLSTGGGSLLGG